MPFSWLNTFGERELAKAFSADSGGYVDRETTTSAPSIGARVEASTIRPEAPGLVVKRKGRQPDKQRTDPNVKIFRAQRPKRVKQVLEGTFFGLSSGSKEIHVLECADGWWGQLFRIAVFGG
jgi:hypothetical protein